MWSSVNAQQIIFTYSRLNLKMPANVILVSINLEDISNFKVFQTD
jgi:hypothetical protein